jgi:arginyl-tRNA--protein-N-Asp/Glu arginylyltransferase
MPWWTHIACVMGKERNKRPFHRVQTNNTEACISVRATVSAYYVAECEG